MRSRYEQDCQILVLNKEQIEFQTSIFYLFFIIYVILLYYTNEPKNIFRTQFKFPSALLIAAGGIG